jgi:hypothetical protein
MPTTNPTPGDLSPGNAREGKGDDGMDPTEYEIRMASRVAESIKKIKAERSALRDKIAGLDAETQNLIAICPHYDFEERGRSCAEDDGPFCTCKICGKVW